MTMAAGDAEAPLRFERLDIPGAWLIEPAMREDERGSFSRTFCASSFAAQELETAFIERSVSINHRAGTLRGLHFQRAPHEETKLVRCIRGAIFDVLVDLRPDSPAFGRWVGMELTPARPRSLYIPTGCAHGFITLVDGSDVQYEITPAYHGASAAGLRWDDPELAIAWPDRPVHISARDLALPGFADWRRGPEFPGGQRGA